MVDRNTEEQLELNDIQGDVLIGLQKDAELFVGFVIKDVQRFKRFLRGLRITTCRDVKRADALIDAARANGTHERLDIRGRNIGFTFDGLRKLGAPGLGGIRDAAFKEGLARRAAALNDPPTGPGAVANWLVGNGVGPLDGMILLTAKDTATVHAMFGDLDRAAGPGTWLPFFTGEGATRAPERGHEHFGFLDGVSQPAIRGRIDHSVPGETFLDPSRDPARQDQGLPGADLHWPGAFVFGYRSQQASDVEKPGPAMDGGAPWMRNGSYMVYRRLEQLVPEFDAKVKKESAATGGAMTPEQLGARIVGRFKSGWPVSVDGKDKPASGTDAMTNNKFEFGGDPTGSLCPFAAHIRKTYPRDDPAPGGEPATQTHRIRRSGIPFGPEVSASEKTSGKTSQSRGLMFVCYQTSIEDQFEFMMKFWVNNSDFLVPGTGEDPVLGQAHGAARKRVVTGLRGPGDKIIFEADFIRATGGGYFFMPSIRTIDTILAV